MFYLIQLLGLFTCICTFFSFYQKEKSCMLLYMSLDNIFRVFIYFLCGSLVGAILVVGAFIRTLVYLLYSKFNRRADVFVIIFCELLYIVLFIIFFENYIDLLMLINLIVITYTSYQENIKIMRYGYLFSSCLLIPYDIILGAYTVTISEVIMLVYVIYLLIKYSKITNNVYESVNRYFKANKYFWGIGLQEYKDFYFVNSKNVDSSYYYNFGVIKNFTNSYSTIKKIKKKCISNNVSEIMYVPFKNIKNSYNYKNANELKSFFPIKYNDVWMRLNTGYNLNEIKCKLSNIEFREVDNNAKDDVINVYLKGYCEKQSIDELNINEINQIKNLKNIDFGNSKNEFKIHIYLAYFNNKAVSLVVMLSNNIETFVTKVSTLPDFRRNHIASSLIQFGINKQRHLGVEEIMLVTDKYSKNEKFYSFNNFKEFGQGYALDISDLSNYDKHLNS